MSKPSYYLSRDNYSTEHMLNGAGFSRTFTVKSKPDLIVLIHSYATIVYPGLYGYDCPGEKSQRSLDKQQDYKEMGLITLAKLEGIPILGLGKGANLLHVHNGGTLTTEETGFPARFQLKSSGETEVFIEEDEDLLHSLNTVQVINDGVEFISSLYDEVLEDEEYIPRLYRSEGNKQLGVDINFNTSRGKKFFESTVLPKLKEMI